LALAGERRQLRGRASGLAEKLGPALERRVGCGFLRLVGLGRPGELDLADDGGKQELERRTRSGEILQAVDRRAQIGEGRQGHVREQLLPDGNVVVVVKLQDVGLELLDLRLAALARRAGVQDPVLDRGRRCDVLETRQHVLVEALECIDAGYALAERLARGPGQHPERVGAGVLGRVPGRQPADFGQVQQRVVGAARERYARKRLLGLGDQRRVRLGTIDNLGQQIEQRGPMLGQPLRVLRRQPLRLGPVDDAKPGFDQVPIELGPADQHQIDLKPLQHVLGIADPPPQILLEAQRESGQEYAFEATPIGRIGGAVQGTPGRQAKAQDDG
jgi:hypothetical protein